MRLLICFSLLALLGFGSGCGSGERDNVVSQSSEGTVPSGDAEGGGDSTPALAASESVESVELSEYQRNWPQWRGPTGNGVALAGNPPIEWSETQNLRWKVSVPGRGHSTPIIWGRKLFLLTAIPKSPAAGLFKRAVGAEHVFGQRRSGRGGGRGGFGTPIQAEEHTFVTLCYDRETGDELWRQVARTETPHEGMSGMGSSEHGYASASPVTDGEHLYAYFGSRGMYCYDLDGQLKWEKDLGDMRTRNAFGEGISPALSGDTLVVVWDEEGDSFIYALDKRSGDILWKKPRDERSSWSTPQIVDFQGHRQVIVNGTTAVRGYDLKSGEVIWECSGQTANAIPVPVYHDGIVIAMSGFRGNALYAIRLGQQGDLTETDAVVWTHDRGTPYVPSPLVLDGKLWFCQKNDGLLSCFKFADGTEYFSQERLGIRGVYASPVAAGNRIYVAGRDGNTVVLENSRQLNVLKTNKLDEKFDASPVVVGDHLFLRGQETLYCIGES